MQSAAVLLEFPLPVVQGTDLPRLQPARDAMEVEGMVAHTPSDGALFACVRALVCLALDAEVHDVIPADGAVVHHNVPSPQRHCT
eukprot:CAMPEP_0171094526 /NCGR_PEP_ID=MMETSP0766_2-20121228/41428_1 /TAXON_ID=439317 /ORGANISM="Gambierdiscus australes, Strain CAWD 149" /LENGTH=84 /DNA_ID=CAMNT_0011553183 /DNA_START=83 /DNA_END=333 /DNA_ORIENTATION=+